MIDRLRELYMRFYAIRTPEQDIALFMANPNGIIVRTTQYIALGKEIVRWMSDEELRNPETPIPAGEKPDGYYIYAYVGDFTNFLQFMPYELPWVGWHRRERLRFYSIPQIRRKIRDWQNAGTFGAFLVPPLANCQTLK